MTRTNQLNLEFIDFKCPYCHAALSFSEAHLGTAQECPHCSESVVVMPRGSEMGGKIAVPIPTARLNLRYLRTEDLPDWLEFVQDEDSYQYLDYYEPNAEDAISWFEYGKVLRLTNPNNGRLTLGIEFQKESKIIGYASLFLTDPEEHRQAYFHILLHPAYRCQGYGTEAVLGLIDLGINGIALHDLRVRIDNRNLAARRMVEKVGMKLEGEFIEESRIKGEWASSAYYVFLAAWVKKSTAI